MNTSGNNQDGGVKDAYLSVDEQKDEQKDELKAKLAGFKGKVTGEEKMEIALDLGVSIISIERYMRGQVAKIPFAKKLVDALNKKVNAA